MIHSSGEGTGERLKKAVGFGVKVSSITRQTLVLPVAVVLAGCGAQSYFQTLLMKNHQTQQNAPKAPARLLDS